MSLVYSVYVLRSSQTGKLYIGHTNNLQRRLRQHNDASCWLTKYTKRNDGPWEIAYTEEFDTRSKAMLRERLLKSGQGRQLLKERLKFGIPR